MSQAPNNCSCNRYTRKDVNLFQQLELCVKIKSVLSYLLNQVDGRLEIQSEINELPLDSFSLVFLLLENEHLN